MRKVLLCGGTNAGRVVTVLHGTAVSVTRTDGAGRETYRRPYMRGAVDGIEHWSIDQPRASSAMPPQER